jgi:hypothetical protein
MDSAVALNAALGKGQHSTAMPSARINGNRDRMAHRLSSPQKVYLSADRPEAHPVSIARNSRRM